MKSLLTALFLLALAAPAQAGLSRASLEAVGVSPPRNAHIPIDARLTDDAGRSRRLAEAVGDAPVVLLFADYTCQTLCGPALDFVTQALAASHLVPGRDYRLLVIGLDPKDKPADAATMKRDRIADPAVAAASTLFTGDEDVVKRLTESVGYRYAYDAEHDQYAHPAAAFVLTHDGRVARVLSELGITGDDLRLALVDADAGRAGTLADHLRLLCYGFDPMLGLYTLSIQRILMVMSLATVLTLAASIAWLARRPRRAECPEAMRLRSAPAASPDQ